MDRAVARHLVQSFHDVGEDLHSAVCRIEPGAGQDGICPGYRRGAAPCGGIALFLVSVRCMRVGLQPGHDLLVADILLRRDLCIGVAIRFVAFRRTPRLFLCFPHAGRQLRSAHHPLAHALGEQLLRAPLVLLLPRIVGNSRAVALWIEIVIPG